MRKALKRSVSVLLAFAMLLGMTMTGLAAVERQIKDDLGRTVTLPATVRKISPSGILSQIAVYSIDPSIMTGLAQKVSDAQVKYMPESVQKLPVVGQMYGTYSTPSGYDEASVKVSGAQVVVDVGQIKGKPAEMAKDYDELQARLGIPVVFIQADEMDSYPHLYDMLGQVLGSTAKTEKLQTYCQDFVDYVSATRATIPFHVRMTSTVYYAEGADGLLTNGTTGAGSIHQQTFTYIGAHNVATIESPQGRGQTPVTMAQVQAWNPNIIIFGPDSIYSTVESNKDWAKISAIKNGKFVEIPEGPFNWLDRPPSINRILGTKWLAHLIFPDYYTKYAGTYNMKKIILEFYELFYHYELSEKEVLAFMEQALFW